MAIRYTGDQRKAVHQSGIVLEKAKAESELALLCPTINQSRCLSDLSVGVSSIPHLHAFPTQFRDFGRARHPCGHCPVSGNRLIAAAARESPPETRTSCRVVLDEDFLTVQCRCGSGSSGWHSAMVVHSPAREEPQHNPYTAMIPTLLFLNHQTRQPQISGDKYER